MPQRGLPVDAGLLAERTSAEDGHQGHPQPPADPGQEPTSVSGHPGVGGNTRNPGGQREVGCLNKNEFKHSLSLPFWLKQEAVSFKVC